MSMLPGRRPTQVPCFYANPNVKRGRWWWLLWRMIVFSAPRISIQNSFTHAQALHCRQSSSFPSSCPSRGCFNPLHYSDGEVEKERENWEKFYQGILMENNIWISNFTQTFPTGKLHHGPPFVSHVHTHLCFLCLIHFREISTMFQ